MPRKRQHTQPPAPVTLPAPEPANEQRDTFFSIQELAARWRLSRPTVSEVIKSGRLQAFKVGRQWRIREAEVLRYEQQHIERAAS